MKTTPKEMRSKGRLNGRTTAAARASSSLTTSLGRRCIRRSGDAFDTSDMGSLFRLG
jgi:hypothetical protein